jgi:dienelactone hydrolase
MMIVAVCSPSIIQASTSLWGDLQSGPYEVGFRTIEKSDHSRSYRPKSDYYGEPMPGNRARQLQVCYWYPAQADPSASVMVLSEYAFPSPDDYDFFAYVSAIQRQALGLLTGMTGIERGVLLDAISIEVRAVRDAAYAEGKFPVIIYHPDQQGGIIENAILCEYLASHGYVVALTHNAGTAALEVTTEVADIETLVRDREMAVSYLRELEIVDPDALGLLGRGFGGLTALVMQSRYFEVDAVVTLDDWCLNSAHLELVSGCPLLNTGRLDKPVLRVYRSDDTTLDRSVVDTWRYSSRYFLPVSDLPPTGISIYPALSTILTAGFESPPEISHPAYDLVCTNVERFFRCHLTYDGRAMEVGVGDYTMELGEPLPPTPDQFMGIIRSRGAVEAEQIFKKYEASDPGLLTIDEAAFNMLGYQALQRGKGDEAVILFRMNADAHPASANVWDSYADGMQAISDTAGTLMCYRKVLEVLSGDVVMDSATAVVLRTNAEQGLARLVPTDEKQ